MKSVDAAQEASDKLHKNYIESRYIEVFQVGVATEVQMWVRCGSDGWVWLQRCRWACGGCGYRVGVSDAGVLHISVQGTRCSGGFRPRGALEEEEEAALDVVWGEDSTGSSEASAATRAHAEEGGGLTRNVIVAAAGEQGTL